MLTPRLTNCQDCHKIPDLLKNIDCKLAELGNNMYNNVVFMLGRDVPAYTISQLLAYKRILTFKYCNPSYAGTISVNDIAAKVIRLTSGCVSRCNTPTVCEITTCCVTVVPNPSTTTTSTSSTSTTTTTSTSSTSTTTSTTTLDPDCRVEGCFQVRDFPPVPSCDEPFNTNNPEGFPDSSTGNGTKTLSNGVVLTTSSAFIFQPTFDTPQVYELCNGYFINTVNATTSSSIIIDFGEELTMSFNPPINSIAFVSTSWGYNGSQLGEMEVVSIESLTPIAGEQMLSCCTTPGVDPTYETIQVNANQVNIQGVQNVPSVNHGATIIKAESGGIEELVISNISRTDSKGITLDFYVCAGTAPTTTTTTSSSPPVDIPCIDGLDVAFVFDYTASMAGIIENVKAGVAGIVNTIATEAGAGGYRLALTTSDQVLLDTHEETRYANCVDYLLLPESQRLVEGPFESLNPILSGNIGTDIISTVWEKFNDNNQAAFNTQLQKLNGGVDPSCLGFNCCVGMGYGAAGPEPCDYVSKLITESNFAGAFRSNVAKYIIIITDNFPGSTRDYFDIPTWNGIQDMITYANANGIKYFVLGPGVDLQGGPFPNTVGALLGIYPWRELAEQTGGSWNSSSDAQTIQDEIVSGCNPTTTTTTTAP